MFTHLLPQILFLTGSISNIEVCPYELQREYKVQQRGGGFEPMPYRSQHLNLNH